MTTWKIVASENDGSEWIERGEAEARIRDLEAQLSDRHNLITSLKDQVTDRESTILKLDELVRERDAARALAEQLAKYARHESYCAIEFYDHDTDKCTCGFSKVIAASLASQPKP